VGGPNSTHYLLQEQTDTSKYS